MGMIRLANPGRACAACDYPLHLDLPEKVCPECGRPFSFFDPSTTFPAGPEGRSMRLRRAVRRAVATWPVLLTLSVVATWLFALLGPMSPLSLFPLLAPLVKRRWGVAALCCVLSPFGVSAIVAALGYARGTGAVCTVGLVRAPGPNLDPSTRSPTYSTGCLVYGNEWVWQVPNNLVMRALAGVLGPQRGAYSGAYPDEVSADRATRDGEVVPFADLAADRIRVGGQTVTLPAGTCGRLMPPSTDWGWRLADFLVGRDVGEDLNDLGPIRAALFEPGCLAVRLPGQRGRLPSEPHGYSIVLIDLATGEPFAVYEVDQR